VRVVPAVEVQWSFLAVDLLEPRESEAVAVGRSGDDEEPLAPMRRAGVGRANASPSPHVPHSGQVFGDDVEAEASVAADVFEDDERRPKVVNGSGDPWPKVAGVVDPAASSGVAEWLAGVSGDDGGDAVELAPVDALEVAEVGDVGPVSGEDGVGMGVYLRVVEGGRVEGGLDREVEAADAGADGEDAHGGLDGLDGADDVEGDVVRS
jgi:hypothetical protein